MKQPIVAQKSRKNTDIATRKDANYIQIRRRSRFADFFELFSVEFKNDAKKYHKISIFVLLFLRKCCIIDTTLGS